MWLLLLAALVAAALAARGGVAPASRLEQFAVGQRGEAETMDALLPLRRLPAEPVRVEVPAIAVDAAIVPVGLERDGALETPPAEQAGWYRLGPRPGARGSAVLAGHVDGPTGPAVFAQLAQLRPGHVIGVRGADGWVTVFVVRDVTRHAKESLPAELWQPHPRRVLRLITCGGAFDAGRRSYRDNIVVHATAEGSWRPPAGLDETPLPWTQVRVRMGTTAA